MDMEKEEENPSSSEEEEEEEEDVPLDSDMEQVSGRNLATYSAHAIPPPATGETHSLFTPLNPVLGRSSPPV